MRFTRPEHQIADVRGRIGAGCSWEADAFLGGGTAIGLGLGKYRRPKGRWEIGEPNPDSDRQEFSRSSNGAAPQGGGQPIWEGPAEGSVLGGCRPGGKSLRSGCLGRI